MKKEFKLGRPLLRFINTKVDPIVEAVKAKLDARSRLGIEKYGTTLASNKMADNDDTYWLRQMQEEAMDFINYIEAEINKLNKQNLCKKKTKTCKLVLKK